MALERTEIRARELESGDLFHEYGDYGWHEVVSIEHGDDMRVETSEGLHIIIDGDSPVLVVKGADQSAVDAIATALGTSTDWNADTLDTIARIIDTTRPEVGDATTGKVGYRTRFRMATGRPVPAYFDMTEDE